MRVWRQDDLITLICLEILIIIGVTSALPPAQRTIELPGVQITISKQGNTQYDVHTFIQNLENTIILIESESVSRYASTMSVKCPN